MARVQNTLIGKASGSIGNATFSTWKGINVLKEKAASVANPRTDKQLMRRSALSQVVIIFRLIAAIVDLGFKKMAIKKSSYNAFLGEALKSAFDYAVPPEATFEAGSFKISKGTIGSTAITAVVSDVSDGATTVSWDANTIPVGGSVSDIALCVVYNSTLNLWAAGPLDILRQDASIVVPLGPGWAAANSITAYLGFYSNISGEAADSTNASTIIVA